MPEIYNRKSKDDLDLMYEIYALQNHVEKMEIAAAHMNGYGMQ